MRENICRVEAGTTAFDYSSAPKTQLSSGSGCFSGMLQEQCNRSVLFDSVVDPIVLHRTRSSYGPRAVRFVSIRIP